MLKPLFNRKPGWFSPADLHLLILLLAAAFLVSCQSPSPQPLVTASSEEPAAPAVQTATPTLLPTPTQNPEQVILWAPEGSDPGQVEVLEGILADLTQEAGYVLDVHTSTNDLDLSGSPKLVVALPPAEGLGEMVAAFPEIQFLAVGLPGLEPAQNLSQIGFSEDSPAQRAFLAGYTAALITPDWRVGLIYPSDSPDGEQIQQSFQNGITFYCGLCRPAYPPYYTYPLIVGLSDSATEAEIQAQVEQLSASAVETVYLASEAPQPALIQQLAAAGIHIIGNVSAAPEAQAVWVASIRGGLSLEDAFKQLWPDLIAGQGGTEVELSMSLEDINPDLLSPGRQRLAEEMLVDLAGGWVQP